MVIKASSAAEIRALVDALVGSDDVRRDAAMARLAVIGARAVDRLVGCHRTASREGRTAILRALEPLADSRALPLAEAALARGGDEAAASVGVLRGLVDSGHQAAATASLDLLVRTALDPAADRRVRLAAFDALPQTPPDIRARVREALRESAAEIAPRAPSDGGTEADEALWIDALEGRLPDRPALLRGIVHVRGATAPLSALQRLIDASRVREAAERDAATRREWLALRGSLHQALGLRGSRVALYDLRESFSDAGGPLPASFLAAVHAVGDASCLDTLADAMARAGVRDAAWRQQLAAAFHAVARRERLTRRHAVMKRALAKCPALAGG